MGCRGVESVSRFGVEVSRPGLRDRDQGCQLPAGVFCRAWCFLRFDFEVKNPKQLFLTCGAQRSRGRERGSARIASHPPLATATAIARAVAMPGGGPAVADKAATASRPTLPTKSGWESRRSRRCCRHASRSATAAARASRLAAPPPDRRREALRFSPRTRRSAALLAARYVSLYVVNAAHRPAFRAPHVHGLRVYSGARLVE